MHNTFNICIRLQDARITLAGVFGADECLDRLWALYSLYILDFLFMHIIDKTVLT
jgi:hypothetical protein